jgi:4-aminobutyrate aminotransferase-like enzyme
VSALITPHGVERSLNWIEEAKLGGATVAGYNNVLTLSPPLNIEEEALSFLVKTLTEALWQTK